MLHNFRRRQRIIVDSDFVNDSRKTVLQSVPAGADGRPAVFTSIRLNIRFGFRLAFPVHVHAAALTVVGCRQMHPLSAQIRSQRGGFPFGLVSVFSAGTVQQSVVTPVEKDNEAGSVIAGRVRVDIVTRALRFFMTGWWN